MYKGTNLSPLHKIGGVGGYSHECCMGILVAYTLGDLTRMYGGA
ncbi:hypothetical protein IX332_000255 [Porphyromonas levii]|nr:hypothetical protein [Porphyromonas levii]MBR8713730.1 hypothetical protein [Porphyromonas levii]MBR8715746.1 hypothetical protein [Porphyromonas levii]MBR8728294.1 hypothetical protein [Porphyromonas levii]MBR8728947.1 hypothetical protein [Porphyromonas levii]